MICKATMRNTILITCHNINLRIWGLQSGIHRIRINIIHSRIKGTENSSKVNSKRAEKERFKMQNLEILDSFLVLSRLTLLILRT